MIKFTFCYICVYRIAFELKLGMYFFRMYYVHTHVLEWKFVIAKILKKCRANG